MYNNMVASTSRSSNVATRADAPSSRRSISSQAASASRSLAASAASSFCCAADFFALAVVSHPRRHRLLPSPLLHVIRSHPPVATLYRAAAFYLLLPPLPAQLLLSTIRLNATLLDPVVPLPVPKTSSHPPAHVAYPTMLLQPSAAPRSSNRPFDLPVRRLVRPLSVRLYVSDPAR